VGEMKPTAEIKEWLASPEIQALLWQIARKIDLYLRSSKIPSFFFDRDTQLNEHRDDIISTIQSELVLFILENGSGIQNLIVSGDRNIPRALRSRFIYYCLDKVRRPDKDSYRYLYKRASDILRQSDSFYTTTKDKKALVYSLQPENRRIPPLFQEDFKAIAFPADLAETLDYDSINRKAVLLKLADYFWNRISEIWQNRHVWVELRNLITWIGFHVLLHTRVQEEANPDGQAPIDAVPDNQYRPDLIYFDSELVEKWAGCVANCFTDREKEIFHRRYGPGLTLKEIAGDLGYKGSSGPKYYLDSAEHKLRKFLRDKPGLSPDDLNDEAFALFRRKLFLILKESISKP